MTGTVESLDSEVAKVVELVMEHAVKRPRESLMVITASTRHAARVHQAVLAAFAKRTDLSDFILKDRAEPFTVLTLEQAVAQSRDRVIFSVGFGRTPHGRLLSNFGSLGEPGGDRLLAVGMTRARRSMDIVSAFGPRTSTRSDRRTACWRSRTSSPRPRSARPPTTTANPAHRCSATSRPGCRASASG